MSEKLPRVDCQELIRALKRAGFEEERQRGSHLHLRNTANHKRVTVPITKLERFQLGYCERFCGMQTLV